MNRTYAAVGLAIIAVTLFFAHNYFRAHVLPQFFNKRGPESSLQPLPKQGELGGGDTPSTPSATANKPENAPPAAIVISQPTPDG